MKYKKIKRCQISNSTKLQKILSLGLIPPVNQMINLNLPRLKKIGGKIFRDCF